MFNLFKKKATRSIEYGVVVKRCSDCGRLPAGHLKGWKYVPDSEAPGDYFLESPDGYLRLIYHAGQYKGFYCTTVTEPMG